MKNTFSLFRNYVFLAGVAAIVDFSVLYGLVEFFKVHYLIGGLIAYVLAMLTNFSLNKVYNFRNKSKRISLQFSIFASVALIGLLLNQIILYTLVDLKEMWYIHAKVFSVSIVMFWSFFGHKKITFNILK